MSQEADREELVTTPRRFAVTCFLISMLSFSVLRLVLYYWFGRGSGVNFGTLATMFLLGCHADLGVALLLTAAVLFGYLITPNKWFARPEFRAAWQVGLVVFWTAFFFLLVVEFHFFAEFNSRFNTVAVDYVLYPYEVFVNIWEAYPVLPLLGACAAAGLLVSLILRGVAWQVFEDPQRVSVRRKYVVITLLLAAAAIASLHWRQLRFSDDRVINEIGNNGLVSLVSAAITRDIDFPAFYQTISAEIAEQRAKTLISGPGEYFDGKSGNLSHRVEGDSSRPRLNVVLILEESLGSEFWGSLGRPGKSLTPEMDRIATTYGLLFTNFYASGNRTVRGLEGILCSFPPLPGDSIVVRSRSDHVETLARLLKRDGYSTHFLYGGRGLFDGMRSFMLRNGYERFIERKDFSHPTHTTVWGVCDEDLFSRGIEEMRELSKSNRPFFLTMLTVSNHKPFTYPAGRISENPNEKNRNHAVKYADFSLGQFFRAAESESFYKNTIFVVVADHGARVYGSQNIPLRSYEIPLVIVGPAVVGGPRRIGRLGCSLDVAPTVLGLIGRPYETVFFGKDILKNSASNDWVVLHHNRDIGMFQNNRMVVLGLNKSVDFYRGDPKFGVMRKVATPDALDEELRQDAIALFQTADTVYTRGNYRVNR